MLAVPPRRHLAAVRAVVEARGVFCALYSDRASHFFVTPKAGGKVDPGRLTTGKRGCPDVIEGGMVGRGRAVGTTGGAVNVVL